MNKKIIIIVSCILVVGLGIYIYSNMNFEDVTEGEVTVNNITIDEGTKLDRDKILLGSWYICNNNLEFVYYEDNTGVRISSDNTEQFEWKFEDNILDIMFLNERGIQPKVFIEFVDDNNEMIVYEESTMVELNNLLRSCP